MVFFEALNGIFEDGTHRQSFGFHRFLENRLVVIGDRAYKSDRCFCMVLHEVAADELHEMVIDEVVDALVFNMIGAELRELRQEAVGEGLAIDLLDDIRHGGLVFGEERLFEVVAQLIFQQVAYEPLA